MSRTATTGGGKMADLRSYRRELVLEIINCFKEQGCLWMYTNRDYKNKVLKSLAYDKLLEIHQKHDPTCTIANVKKIIQSLRASHRKERKKVQDSMKTGSGANDVYIPKLWYYAELEFLDQIESTSSVSTLDEINTYYTGDDSNITMTTSESEIMAPSSVSSLGVASPSEPSPRTRSQPTKTKKPNEQEQREKNMAKIAKKLEHTEDDFDVVGKNIANKLRAMDADQRIHAEKIINDTLYYGTLKHLTFDSCITGTVGRTTTVIERPNPYSAPLASQATYSQPVSGHSNYPITPNNIVTNNNNFSYSQLLTQPETVALNTEHGLQTSTVLDYNACTQSTVQNFLQTFTEQ